MRDPEQVVASLDAVLAAAAVRTSAEARVADSVADSRRAGATWREIGVALGVSGQAAQQRYGSEA